MTKEEVTRLIGASAVIDSKRDSLGGDELETNTAPNPYSICKTYDLHFSRTEGLLAVSCTSDPIADLESRGVLQAIFESVKAELTYAYDSPTNEIDARAPSKYSPETLMHSTSWNDSSGGIVMLAGFANQNGTSRISISYLFKGWFPYIDRVQAKDSPL